MNRRWLAVLALLGTHFGIAEAQQNNAATTQADNATTTAQNTGGGATPTESGELPTTEIDVSLDERRDAATTLFATEDGGVFEAVTSNSGGRGSSRSFNSANTNRSTTNRSTTTRSRQIRPQFRIGFAPSQTLTFANVQVRAARRLARAVPRARQLSGVAVQASQTKGVIALSGTVQSESARRLAAALIRLEPGVRKVQNNLQLAQAPVPPSAPAAPPGPPQIRTRP